MKLKHFESVADVHSYVWAEIVATLRDDLANMEGKEYNAYEEADREEMRNRIADIEAISPNAVRTRMLQESMLQQLANAGVPQRPI